jgi:hypothetical protein
MMNFVKRFNLHIMNEEQVLVSMICAIIFQLVILIFGGAFTILSFVSTVLLQSLLSHIFMSIMYSFENQYKKVQWFPRRGDSMLTLLGGLLVGCWWCWWM